MSLSQRACFHNRYKVMSYYTIFCDLQRQFFLGSLWWKKVRNLSFKNRSNAKETCLYKTCLDKGGNFALHLVLSFRKINARVKEAWSVCLTLNFLFSHEFTSFEERTVSKTDESMMIFSSHQSWFVRAGTIERGRKLSLVIFLLNILMKKALSNVLGIMWERPTLYEGKSNFKSREGKMGTILFTALEKNGGWWG